MGTRRRLTVAELGDRQRDAERGAGLVTERALHDEGVGALRREHDTWHGRDGEQVGGGVRVRRYHRCDDWNEMPTVG